MTQGKMSIDILPFELLVELFEYLGVSDLLAASCVCSQWREAAASLLAERVTIMITDDAQPALHTLYHSSIPYHHWVFKVTLGCSDNDPPVIGTTCKYVPSYGYVVEADIKFKGQFERLWGKVSHEVQTLLLLNVEMTQQDLVSLLGQCSALEDLRIEWHKPGIGNFLLTGTLLSNPEDRAVLSSALRRVTHLHLACSRYLTDSLFSRIISCLGSLRKLSLAGCQITFHDGIYKRFYPKDGSVNVSDHVLTFKHILQHIEQHASTLKEISLGRTIIDSQSLCQLSKVPGLKLESVHLMSCDQLSKSGIELLCQNQGSITDLDLGLCSRVTDYAVLAIAQRLPKIRRLNLRRCQGITETGMRALSQLKHLEELNISHLESVTSESVVAGLGERRPDLRILNMASLQLAWTALETLTSVAPNLTHLDLSMCGVGINDKSIQAICKSLRRLRNLNLNGCSTVSDIGMSGHGLGQRDPSAVTTNFSLENLGLAQKDPLKVELGSRAEKTIRQEAAVKKYLQNNIEQVVQSSEYGLSNLTGLRELNLCGCQRLTDITLIYALKLQELHYLNLSHCQGVGEAGLQAVARNCPSLEVLMLAECSQTTDQVVLVIAHYLRRIKTLDLQMCVQLSDDALDSLGGCGTLRYLDVSGCPRMTLEEVHRLQQRIPRLLNLHHRGIKEESSSKPSVPPALNSPPAPPLFPQRRRRGFIRR